MRVSSRVAAWAGFAGSRSSILLIFLFSFSLLYSFAGYGDVFQVSEGREGVVIGAMVHDRTPFAPLRHRQLIPSKPILSHLVGYLDYCLRGQFDERMLRTASVLGGAIMATVLFARVLAVSASLPLAVLAFSMLFFSYGFQRLALDGRVDMLFNALLAAAMLLAASMNDGLDSDKSRSFARINLAGLLVGAAVLTKGPLGLALSLLILSFYWHFSCASSWRFVFAASFRLCLGAGLVFLPWYLVQWQLYGQRFLMRQIVFENIDRLRGAEGITAKPFWFYLPQIFPQWAPWSFILSSLLVWFFFRNRRFGVSFLMKFFHELSRPLSLHEKRLCQLSFFWIIIPLILFSISFGKRRGYLLTVLPAFSIIGAFGVRGLLRFYSVGLMERLPGINRALSRVAVLTIFLLSGLSMVLAYCNPWPGLGTGAPLMLEFVRVARQQLAEFPLIVFLPIFFLIFWLHGRLKAENTGVVATYGLVVFVTRSVFLLWLFFVAVLHFFMAVKADLHSYRNLAYQVRERVADFSRLRFIKEDKEEDFDALFFYLEKPVLLQPPDTPLKEDIYYLARVKWFKGWSDEASLGYQVLLTGGRTLDSQEDRLILFHTGGRESK